MKKINYNNLGWVIACIFAPFACYSLLMRFDLFPKEQPLNINILMSIAATVLIVGFLIILKEVFLDIYRYITKED